MKNAPIYSFVKRYAQRGAVRAHMPGHKGKRFLGPEPLDITEIAGADALYHANGIILQSEKYASVLFGSQKTLYSTEGSSHCIRAMLYLAKLYAASTGKEGRILCARNAHKSLLSAAALTDTELSWLYGEGSLLSYTPDFAEIEARLQSERPVALFVTSPDYLGNTLDLFALSSLCHRYGALLLVDNAHGAYLRFLSPSLHPLDASCDLCCDSAHKTLPALTGAAYLHIGQNAPLFLSQAAEGAMALFASTSPSYLTLSSLDTLNELLFRRFPRALENFLPKVKELKESLTANGYRLVGDEPLKLTLATKSYGYLGETLAALLERKRIFVEHADADHVVLMLSPLFGGRELVKIGRALLSIPHLLPIEAPPPPAVRGEAVLSPREALFRPTVTAPLEWAKGKILGGLPTACPPAVPILMPGEKITEEAIEAFRYYGYREVAVLCE